MYSLEVINSTFYVTPTFNSPCPGELCLVLSEYINQANQYFTPNTTLVFLPGNHTVKSGLLVDGISSLTLLGMSSSDESVPLIVCSTPASFAIQNILKLSICSLAFEACGDGIHAWFSMMSVDQIEISRSIFINSLGSGGSLVMLNIAEVTLSNNRFLTNTATVGGAIYARESVIHASDNHFINNTASIAGAGIMLLNSSITITGAVSFSNNSILDFGKEMTETIDGDVQYRQNYQSITDTAMFAGGAMFTSGSTVTVLGNISIRGTVLKMEEA